VLFFFYGFAFDFCFYAIQFLDLVQCLIRFAAFTLGVCHLGFFEFPTGMGHTGDQSSAGFSIDLIAIQL
jgi:hypothetical protein